MTIRFSTKAARRSGDASGLSGSAPALSNARNSFSGPASAAAGFIFRMSSGYRICGVRIDLHNQRPAERVAFGVALAR